MPELFSLLTRLTTPPLHTYLLNPTREDILKAFEILGREWFGVRDEILYQKAYQGNNWFTAENIERAFRYWSGVLTPESLGKWLAPYSFEEEPKKIGIIMAGNLPMVGFHDLLCVLLSGNKALVKLSSDDEILIRSAAEFLFHHYPELEPRIEFSEKIKDCDAVIATGSNNTSRYFEYYFKSLPKILRRNRKSLAVLDGKESHADLENLASDIFSYFGLGCRNVSKILVPEDYRFDEFFPALENYRGLIHHNKYYNNYTYHKAIFLMNRDPHLDNGFLLLKESGSLGSPLGCLYYQHYTSEKHLLQLLEQMQDEIQAVVSGRDISAKQMVRWGNSQSPELGEYADRIDTMKFLNQLTRQ